MTAIVATILAVGFDLSSIASTRQRHRTCGVHARYSRPSPRPCGKRGENLVVLVFAIAMTVIVLLTFAFTTLVDEPGTAVTLVAILVLSIVLDVGWKRVRDRRLSAEAAPAAGG